MAIGYIILMLFLVRPLVVRVTGWIAGKGRTSQSTLAFVLLAILFSSLATESIGIHSIFGAFVLGAVIPHGSNLARDLTNKLEDFVIVFLLPAFFAFTGLRTQIGLVSSTREWMFCLLIIGVASLGKFRGSTVAAKLNGLSWRDSSALGVLMNTRGLMELIVLNIGLELHVISPTLFAMLVIMSLATTLATTPILHFIMPRRTLEEEVIAIDRASWLPAAVNERSGTLFSASNADAVAGLLEVALSLTPSEGPPPRVLAVNRGNHNGVGSPLKETERLSPSRSPILVAALDDAAFSRGNRPDSWKRQIKMAERASTREDIYAIEIADGKNIVQRLPKGFVVIAKDVVDKWHLAFEGLTEGRTVIVVQGTGKRAAAPVAQSLEFEAFSASAT